MGVIRILLFILLFFNTLSIGTKKTGTFVSPVKIPVALSANFGELRIDHFHSGLDIKTQGVTGKEVVAAASGYVYRISVSPGGFGKALYIRHPSGYSTVYGHLERFTPEMEAYVRSGQYEKKSFLVTLYPARDRFPVAQGDVIAYSGNSGTSGGPHLHYEIRKSESEIPVNPLFFDFGVTDNVRPVIDRLVIYPLNGNTLINNQNRKRTIAVTGSGGRYAVPADADIEISGAAGFGIRTWDQLDDSNNKCAIYSLELLIDSISVFKYVMDAFSFGESRYINSHIDYETYQKEKVYIERTYVLPGDKLSVYKNLVNRGIVVFNDDRVHKGEIIATDIDGNRSVLTFRIRAKRMTGANYAVAETVTGKMMPYNRNNSFDGEGIRLSIPEGALYDTIYFTHSSTGRTKGMLSGLHSVHNAAIPLHKACVVAIKPDTIPPGKKSKMLLLKTGDKKIKTPVNSYWSDGYLAGEIRSFGNYYVGIDTIAPEISARSLVQGADLSGRTDIRIGISDDLSGINYYEPSIDGKWALFEYDQKNDVIIYTFDPARITRGTKHNLSLKVADNRDNMSYFNYAFYW